MYKACRIQDNYKSDFQKFVKGGLNEVLLRVQGITNEIKVSKDNTITKANDIENAYFISLPALELNIKIEKDCLKDFVNLRLTKDNDEKTKDRANDIVFNLSFGIISECYADYKNNTYRLTLNEDRKSLRAVSDSQDLLLYYGE